MFLMGRHRHRSLTRRVCKPNLFRLPYSLKRGESGEIVISKITAVLGLVIGRTPLVFNAIASALGLLCRRCDRHPGTHPRGMPPVSRSRLQSHLPRPVASMQVLQPRPTRSTRKANYFLPTRQSNKVRPTSHRWHHPASKLANNCLRAHMLLADDIGNCLRRVSKPRDGQGIHPKTMWPKSASERGCLQRYSPKSI